MQSQFRHFVWHAGPFAKQLKEKLFGTIIVSTQGKDFLTSDSINPQTLMNKYQFKNIITLFLAGSFFSGCRAIGSIFKAGVWAGAIAIAVLVAIILWIVSKLNKK